MALPNWQQLQKNIDDPETIEQAIIRLVNSHEEDPEAHLGVGESLEQHKTQSVIDHPAQSIVPDKIAGGNIHLYSNFRPIDHFDVVGGINTFFPFRTEFNCSGTPDTFTSLAFNSALFPRSSAYKGDFVFDISFWAGFGYLEVEDWHIGNFLINIGNSFNSNRRLGLVYENGEMKVFWSDGNTLKYSPALPPIIFDNSYTFRIFLDWEARKINFFLNGQIIYIADFTTWTYVGDYCLISLEQTLLEDTGLQLYSFDLYSSPRVEW